MNTKLPT